MNAPIQAGGVGAGGCSLKAWRRPGMDASSGRRPGILLWATGGPARDLSASIAEAGQGQIGRPTWRVAKT